MEKMNSKFPKTYKFVGGGTNSRIELTAFSRSLRSRGNETACSRTSERGFTLAEVLITLAIIGIVAALTIPTVVKNYQEKQTVAKVKKFYSTISQAFQMARATNGPIESYKITNNAGTGAGSAELLNYFAPFLKITKNNGAGNKYTYEGTYKNITGDTWYIKPNNDVRIATAELTDGTAIFVYYEGTNCGQSYGETQALSNICGRIYVDINSKKQPNALGKDVFTFHITKYGILPAGTKNDTNYGFDYCDKDATSSSTSNGTSCTSWVLNHENLDYLKRDVSSEWQSQIED